MQERNRSALRPQAMPAIIQRMDLETVQSLLLRAARSQAMGKGTNTYGLASLRGQLENLGTDRVPVRGVGETALPTSATVVELRSSDPRDTFGGDGTHLVQVRGLNADFSSGNVAKPFLEEVVPLIGPSPWNTQNTFLRVTELRSVLSGVLRRNAGVITGSVGSVDQMNIPVDIVGFAAGRGRGQSFSSSTSIPAGWIGITGIALLQWTSLQPARFWCHTTTPLPGPNGRPFAPSTNEVEAFTAEIIEPIQVSLNPLGLVEYADIGCEAAQVTGGGSGPFGVSAAILLERIPD